MYLAYIDDRFIGNRYFIGGVLLHERCVGRLDSELHDLQGEIFGVRDLTRMAAFHGSPMLMGTQQFEGMDPSKRAEIFRRIGTILMLQAQDVVICAIWSIGGGRERAIHNLLWEMNYVVQPSREHLLLVADCENTAIKMMMDRFMPSVRRSGINAYMQPSADFLLDVVHFAHSHYSKLLQLADVILYMLQRYNHQSTPLEPDRAWEQTILDTWREICQHVPIRIRRWPEDYAHM